MSMVVGSEEPKVTYINTFDSEINCLIDAAVLAVIEFRLNQMSYTLWPAEEETDV